MVLRIVFSIGRHCSCAGGISPACARTCIVIGVNFPLQIDCIFVRAGPGALGLHSLGVRHETRDQLRATACGRDASAESTAPTGTSVGLGLFGADPKAVASNSIVNAQVVSMTGATPRASPCFRASAAAAGTRPQGRSPRAGLLSASGNHYRNASTPMLHGRPRNTGRERDP
jgi:hypothetical protein